MSCESMIYENKFNVIFNSNKYNTLTKNLTNIIIPSFNIGIAEQPTPIKRFYIPGDSLEMSDVTMTFILDEDYSNYKLFLQWLNTLRNFREIDLNNEIIDISVSLLNTKYNPNVIMNFEDCFPYSMSEIALTYQISDTNPSTFDVIFRINNTVIE